MRLLTFLQGGTGLAGAARASASVYTGQGVKPGSTVTVYKNGTQAGTATADGTGAWSYTFGAAPVAGDVVTYDAVLTSPGSTVPPAALGPTSASYAASATASTVIAAITGLSTGETLASLSPNDGRVAISGANLVVGGAASSAGTTTTYSVSTSTGRTLAIALSVTSAPALAALSLDVVRSATSVPFSANIVGGTAGSTFALSGAGAASLAVSGSKITGTPSATGPVHVTETAADGTTTRTTNAVTTVGSPVQQSVVGGPQFPSVAVAQPSPGGYTQTQIGRFYPVLRTGNQIRVRVGNHFRTTPDGTINGPSNITIKLGASTGPSVAATPFTFAGASSVTLTPGQTALTDPLNITRLGGAYLAGDWIYLTELCTYASAPASFPGQRSIPCLTDVDYSEVGTALTDRTSGTWNYQKALSGYLANHVEGIVGMTAGGPVVLIMGDSIGSDTFNDSAFGFYTGWVQAALARAGIPYVNIGIQSQALYGYLGSGTQNTTNWSAFTAMATDNGCTHVFGQVGTNDFNSGTQNGAQVYANDGVAKSRFDALGMKYIPASLLPRTNAGNTADATGIVPSEMAAYRSSLSAGNGVGYGWYDAYPVLADPVTPNRWRQDIYGATAYTVATPGTGMLNTAVEFDFPVTASGKATISGGGVTAMGARRPGGALASELPANPVAPVFVYSTGGKVTQTGTGATFNITWTLASPTADGTHPAAAHAEYLARDFAAKAPALFGA